MQPLRLLVSVQGSLKLPTALGALADYKENIHDYSSVVEIHWRSER